MNESNDALTILGGEVDASSYLREADVTVENLINPKITNLTLTLSQFDLEPGGGDWDKPAPQQGEQINFGGNPLQASAQNTTYPGEVRGSMVFVVQTHDKLTLDFHSSLTSYGATINGASSACWVGDFLFSLETSVNPQSGQPRFTVKAIQYKQS